MLTSLVQIRSSDHLGRSKVGLGSTQNSALQMMTCRGLSAEVQKGDYWTQLNQARTVFSGKFMCDAKISGPPDTVGRCTSTLYYMEKEKLGQVLGSGDEVIDRFSMACSTPVCTDD